MSNTIQFYQDSPHQCSYLEDQQARNIYPDPNQDMTNQLYNQLIQHGFRRSGDISYRPFCEECQQCIPVRINTQFFKTNRSQRRCLKRNNDLTMIMKPAEFDPEHYHLYCKYLVSRHSGGGMDNPTEESYTNFLTSRWSDTRFIEIRDAQQLVAVAVTDFVANGASAFYTFFDPALEKRSLGTFSILKQIEMTQTHSLAWLYLGYWIKDCSKMSYKQHFSSLEAYVNQQWQPLASLKNFE
ncbi:MAG: arginyltransferase [Proteobacteria bacterium]|nr:arginyltransferase [Pseudomonadota bacterium]